jgi:Ser/Thr protein kinase RdoA (MazF antagonist)
VHRVVLDGAVPLSVFVMPWVAGVPLDPGDAGALRATGAALARVHAALSRAAVTLPGPVTPR